VTDSFRARLHRFTFTCKKVIALSELKGKFHLNSTNIYFELFRIVEHVFGHKKMNSLRASWLYTCCLETSGYLSNSAIFRRHTHLKKVKTFHESNPLVIANKERVMFEN